MKIKILLFTAFIMTIVISCDNNASSPDSQSYITLDTSSFVIEPPKDFINIVVTQLTYESATVYAASTDYYFKNENTGEIIKLRISNSEEATVKIPDNMLQESEDGPPEANKALVGKLFMLSSIEGVITEIELEEDYYDNE